MSERCPECGWVFGNAEKLREHRLAVHDTDTPYERAAYAGPGEPALVTPAESQEGPSRRLLIAGYVTAFLFQVVGLVIGIVLLVQRHTRHGLAIIGISVAVTAAVLTADLSGNDDSSRPSVGNHSDSYVRFITHLSLKELQQPHAFRQCQHPGSR